MTRTGRTLPVVLVLVVLGVAVGCSTTERAEPATTTTAVTVATLLGPDSFARRVEDPQVVTINVHVPDEGSIAGTDLTIPFDEIKTSAELPADRNAPLAVYLPQR